MVDYDATIDERQLRMTDGRRLTLKVYRKAKYETSLEYHGYSNSRCYKNSSLVGKCNTIHRSNGLSAHSLQRNQVISTPRSFSSEFLLVEPQPRATLHIPSATW